ncbi:MAG TPA: cytochrome P450 [Acidimicrobiales bacterium]|nr:cytochrome P450 [Acidimicrobiales bacterium]
MATSVVDLDLPQVDLMESEGREEARRELDQARRQHWLARTPFGYVVTRHEDVAGILRDKRFHSGLAMLSQMPGLEDDEYLQSRRSSILALEGEEHSRLRRLVAPAFTPRSAERLRPFMREVVTSLVDSFSAGGRCDLVADLCDPYPIPIICELLGAPREDWKLFSAWATDIFRIFNANLLDDLPLIKKASAELDEYVGALIEARRSRPANDLLSDLIAIEEGGDRLSSQELVGLAEAVLMAGTDTTRNQLACSVALLSDHPDQWRALAEHPELAPGAVEETMRVLGAVRGTSRFASVDVEYRDVLFPAGTMVALSMVSANFDPEVWADPESLDITRQTKTQQMTFGSGVHFCLGASLARAELQEALPILARRMPNLAVDGQIDWKPSTVGIWGPARLPLVFDPT